MSVSIRTQYERTVLCDARESFENPFRTPISAFAYLVERRGRPSAREMSELMAGETGAVMSAAACGVAALGEVAMTTLRPESVCASFRREGYGDVRSLDDVRRLELWEVDEVVDGLRKKYLLVGAAVGAAAGVAGASALTLDAPLITALAIRAIGDVALHYGFDVRDSAERAYALKVLVASVVPGVAVERATLDDLGRVGAAFTRTVRRGRQTARWGLPLALHVARRLLRPGAGTSLVRRLVSVAAAAANAWLMVGVVETAEAAYRERFLARGAPVSKRDRSPRRSGMAALPARASGAGG